MKSKVRIPIAALGAILISLCSRTARADGITITGNLTSDGSAVGSGDPVISDPSTINLDDPFSIVLSYDPAGFTQSGSSFVLTNTSLTLQFDGYSFGYTSAAGNYIEFSSPGVFGSGTTSFLICSSLANCSTNDFLTLYFQGTVTSPGTLAAQAGGLSGDPGASPSEFEFLRNFSDGSQTDLQGTLGTPGIGSSPVPEPSMLMLLAFGVAGLLSFRHRAQSTITNGLPNCPTGRHFPIIICQAGSYRLSGNVTVPDANTTAIQITVSDVTIDLNGFSIFGPGGKGRGIGIVGSDTSVSNGTIRGMGSQGVFLNGHSSVYKVVAIGNGAEGIVVGLGLVSECISSENGGPGLNVTGIAMNNIVSENAGDGISGSAAVITGNAVLSNTNGINVFNSVISGNVLQQNSLVGIQANCPSLIMGNDFAFNNFGSISNPGTCLLVNNAGE